MLILTNLLKPFFKPFFGYREALWYALRNETDGFAATTMQPRKTGLPAYIIFNCYGYYQTTIKPKKHKTLIVEVAKDDGCKHFDWDKTIPVEVSGTPKILLKGKKLKHAILLFSQQEWEDIYRYIAQHRDIIKRHWIGEADSGDLIDEVKSIESEMRGN